MLLTSRRVSTELFVLWKFFHLVFTIRR
jgi:hypothetical protein